MGMNLCGCNKLEPQVIQDVSQLKPAPSSPTHQSSPKASPPPLQSKPQPFLNTEQNELEELLQREAFKMKPHATHRIFEDLNKPKASLVRAFRKDGKLIFSLSREISLDMALKERKRSIADEIKEIVP